MSQYDFVIEHRSGRQHSNADGMSRRDSDKLACDCYLAGQDPARLPCNGCPHCVKLTKKWARFAEYVDDVVPLAVRCQPQTATDTSAHELNSWLPTFGTDRLRSEQLVDPVLSHLHNWCRDGLPPKEAMIVWSSALRKYWLCWPQIKLINGVLHYM